MAFRRRARQGGIQRPRFPNRRRSWPWTTAFFQQETVTRDGTTTKFTLVDAADYDSLFDVGQSGRTLVHRVQFKGGVTVLTEGTTFGSLPGGFNWIFYGPADDTDIDDEVHPAVANTPYIAHTCYRWGFRAWQVREIPQADQKDMLLPAIPINFDVKFRRPEVLRQQQHMELSMGWSSDMTGVINSCTFSGIVRASIQGPGVR